MNAFTNGFFDSHSYGTMLKNSITYTYLISRYLFPLISPKKFSKRQTIFFNITLQFISQQCD